MLDPRIEAIRTKYNLAKTDFWELPQKKGTYCVKHSALEAVAAQAGIIFDMPTMLEVDSANGLASLIVRGTLGDRSIWSIGECSPKNNRNSYPLAMAEKRAVDRVTLKLCGLHGLVYSEEESDDFKPAPSTNGAKRVSASSLKKDIGRVDKPDNFGAFQEELGEVFDIPTLRKFALAWAAIAERDGWPDGENSWRELAREMIAKRQDEILNPPPQSDFPGDANYVSPLMAGE